MAHGSWIVLTLSALGIMIGLNALSNETLEIADGVPAATKLPLDDASSKVKFQTATFGLG